MVVMPTVSWRTSVAWRFAACLGLLSLTYGCGPSHEEFPYWCPARYPVATGDHGNYVEGHGDMHVVDSEDVEVVDATFHVRHKIWTLDEESNEQQYGVAEPRLYVSIHAHSLEIHAFIFGCHLFVPANPEVIELRLGGTENRFRCVSDPGSDAELILRNVGEISSLPSLWKADLVGSYSENGGAEQYEIRLNTFDGNTAVECDDPAALR